MNEQKTITKLFVQSCICMARSRGLKLAAALLPTVLAASICQAQQRTFVSGLGSDSNPCSRTQPCRNFGQAISVTSAGGEVVVLDSAGYGTLSIANSVSIVAPPGVYAGVSVSSGDGIDITGSSPAVTLRGLTVNNQGSTGNGISYTATGAGILHIEDCVINGFSSNNAAGIAFQPSGSSKLEVKDTVIRGNQFGIRAMGGFAVVDQTRLEGNSAAALEALDGSTVTVRSSTAAAAAVGDGFVAITMSASPVELNIDRCVASGLSIGVVSETGSTGVATVRLSNSTITDNGTGLFNGGSPAVLLLRGNNTVEGNTTNTSGAIGSYTAK